MSNNDGNLVDSPKTPDGSADFSKPLGPYAPHTSIEQVIPAPSPFGRFVTTKPGTFSVSYKGLDTVGREIAAKAVKSPEDIKRQEKIDALKKNLKQIEVDVQAIFRAVELSGLELNYGDDSKNQTTEKLAYLERVTLLYSQLTEQNPDFQEIENQANNIKEELRELESIIRESFLKDDAQLEIPTETQGVPKVESTTPDSIVENRDPGTIRTRCSHVLKMIDSLDANFDQSESNSLHNWGSILKDFLETPSQGSHTYIEKLLGEAERLLVSVASRNTSASPIHLTSSTVLSTIPSTQIPPEQDPALQIALANSAAQAREIVDLESKNQRIIESQTLISNFSKLKTDTTIALSRKKESTDLDSFINELNTQEDEVQELIANFNTSHSARDFDTLHDAVEKYAVHTGTLGTLEDIDDPAIQISSLTENGRLNTERLALLKDFYSAQKAARETFAKLINSDLKKSKNVELADQEALVAKLEDALEKDSNEINLTGLRDAVVTYKTLVESLKEIDEHPLDIWSGWPAFVRLVETRADRAKGVNANAQWMITDSATGDFVPLEKGDMWSKIKTNFDITFSEYENFLKEGDVARKINTSRVLIEAKTRAIDAILSTDTTSSVRAIEDFRLAVINAKSSWARTLEDDAGREKQTKEREVALQKLTEEFDQQKNKHTEIEKTYDIALNFALRNEQVTGRDNEVSEKRGALALAQIAVNEAIPLGDPVSVSNYLKRYNEILNAYETALKEQEGEAQRELADNSKTYSFKDPKTGLWRRNVSFSEYSNELARRKSIEDEKTSDEQPINDIVHSGEGVSTKRLVELGLEQRMRESGSGKYYTMLRNDPDGFREIFLKKKWVLGDPLKPMVESAIKRHLADLGQLKEKIHLNRDQVMKELIKKGTERTGTHESLLLQQIDKEIDELDEKIKTLRDGLTFIENEIDSFEKKDDLDKLRELKERAASANNRFRQTVDPTTGSMRYVGVDRSSLSKNEQKEFDAWKERRAADTRALQEELQRLSEEELRASVAPAVTVVTAVPDQTTTPPVANQPVAPDQSIVPAQPDASPQPAAPDHSQTMQGDGMVSIQLEEETAQLATVEAERRNSKFAAVTKLLNSLTDKIKSTDASGWRRLAIPVVIFGTAVGTAVLVSKSFDDAREHGTRVSSAPRTAGEAVPEKSWRSYLETEELKKFVVDYVDTGIGFDATAKKYLKEMNLSDTNPDTLANVAKMEPFVLLFQEGSCYGLNDQQRKELCDFIMMMKVVGEAPDAEKRKRGEYVESRAPIPEETLATYYTRMLTIAVNADAMRKSLQGNSQKISPLFTRTPLVNPIDTQFTTNVI